MNKIISLLAVSLLSVLNAQAEDDKKSWYVGAGVVFSEVDPETNTDFRVNDDSDSGFQIIIGNRINDHFAVEFSYADLGEAGITEVNTGDTGTLKYQQITLGGVLYPWGEEKLGGWVSPFVGSGIRKTNNSSDDGIPFEQADEYNGYLQLGLEASIAQDWDLRLSYKNYSDDSSIIGVSAIFSAF